VAHNTDKVGFPNIPLSGGMQIRLEAIDPTTDAQVAGVTSTRWSIYGWDDSQPTTAPGPELPVLVLPNTPSSA